MFARTLNIRTALFAATACVSFSGIVPANAAPDVGVAAAVNLDAKSIRGGGAPRVVTLGQSIIFNERIITDTSGLVQILLVDGTTFTIGPGCEMTIDEFVYNPDTGDARVVATIAKGAFRFIGGQTSRTKDGAIINTPSGTIGIRGGGGQGNANADNTTYSVLFGKAEFTDNDGDVTNLETGLTIEASSDGAQSVRFTTDADAQSAQESLSGDTGQSGGSDSQPTDTTVSESGIAGVNSESPQVDVEVTVPTPEPKPVQSSDIDEVEDSVADVDDVAQQEIQEDPISPIPVPARIYRAPDEYTTDFGETFFEPGPRGFVGSTPESDYTVDLTQTIQTLSGTSPFGGTIFLPNLTGSQGDGGLESFNVSGTSPLGPVSGIAYAGRGDFAAYFLGVDGDPTQPYYLIAGTGTDPAVLDSQSTDIRTYTLTPDPIRNLSVPFFDNTIYGPLDNVSQTDFLVAEMGQDSYQVFLTWIDINGTGSGQKSAILVTSGNGSTYNSAPVERVLSNRRGSFRSAANLPQFNIRGSGVQTLPGPDGSHVFGPNAEHAIIGVGVDPNVENFVDIPSEFCAILDCSQSYDPNNYDIHYGTRHVADLVDETPKTSFSRSSRSRVGFMVGTVETETEGYTNPAIVAANSPDPNFSLTLDAGSSQASAFGQVWDINDANPIISSMFIPFGWYDGDFGEGTFIDDDTFGATHNINRENTRLFKDDQTDVAADVFGPGSYMVSGRAAPVAGYEHCTACDFMDWGWWGTRLISEHEDNGNTLRRSDMVHMGTWVAGDITHPNQLLLPSTIASYNGTAIANVATAAGEQYIASGDFSLTIDLSDRAGSLAINNLDGASYSATVSDASTPTQALYSGSLVGVGNSLTGGVNGALVNDGAAIAAGTIGQFHASGAGNQVVGTFMGKQ